MLTLDAIERQHGVSRSVVRETVRVLEALRLVTSRRRVGVVVLPRADWNLFDPRVIRWRMASPDREEQIRSLTELRMAVEPEAAGLAARRAAAADAARLVAIAGELWAASEVRDSRRFLAVDIEFHSLLLRASGNPMFGQLEALVNTALEARVAHGFGPLEPEIAALRLHADIAAAIQRRASDEAATAMRALVRLSREGENDHPGEALE